MITDVRQYSVADMADTSVTIFEQRFPQGWSGGGAHEQPLTSDALRSPPVRGAEHLGED